MVYYLVFICFVKCVARSLQLIVCTYVSIPVFPRLETMYYIVHAITIYSAVIESGGMRVVRLETMREYRRHNVE